MKAIRSLYNKTVAWIRKCWRQLLVGLVMLAALVVQYLINRHQRSELEAQNAELRMEAKNTELQRSAKRDRQAADAIGKQVRTAQGQVAKLDHEMQEKRNAVAKESAADLSARANKLLEKFKNGR